MALYHLEPKTKGCFGRDVNQFQNNKNGADNNSVFLGIVKKLTDRQQSHPHSY